MTGSTNTSLYTGDIDYQDIPSSSVSYWTLPIKNLTVNSNSVSLPSGQSSYAAIDTGTTLIGGPASQVAALYAQIPNSVAGTGNYDGYYLYRALLAYFSCRTTSVLTQKNWFL
jgi:cathepsin D